MITVHLILCKLYLNKNNKHGFTIHYNFQFEQLSKHAKVVALEASQNSSRHLSKGGSGQKFTDLFHKYLSTNYIPAIMLGAGIQW